MEIRLLKANEIDVRVGSINAKGATLLLYKDARVDMNILDESGLKWKRSHELINGNLFCTISVWDSEISEWISRQDVGIESNTEKEKGQASDAFKRAGFNFGIGRELYTAPFIWVDTVTYKGFERNGKFGTYDKFKVTGIAYDTNNEIDFLEIKNARTGMVVFTTLRTKTVTSTADSGADQEIAANTNSELNRAKAIINDTLEKHGYTMDTQKRAFIHTILKKTKITNINDADEVMDALADEGIEE